MIFKKQAGYPRGTDQEVLPISDLQINLRVLRCNMGMLSLCWIDRYQVKWGYENDTVSPEIPHEVSPSDGKHSTIPSKETECHTKGFERINKLPLQGPSKPFTF